MNRRVRAVLQPTSRRDPSAIARYVARPMARLTLDQVRHVAQLAALELSEPEAQAMREDLGAILDYIAALEGVDVSGIEAVFHPSQVASPLRADEVQPSLSRQAALAAAPESEQGGFAVPRVLDGDA